MSPFTVDVVARNPKREELATPPIAALVDTGSELTWLPAGLLQQAGITPRRRRTFSTATKERVTRDVGYAIVSAEGYETNDEVVFAEPGDMILLGVRTLEGFGVVVDSIGHRFITQPTIVAAWTPRGPSPGGSPLRLAGAAQRGDEDRVEALGVR
ncbi:MAG: retroviral-like aspartic protease family protein [Candidatus Rokuibacteriota bacterium]